MWIGLAMWTSAGLVVAQQDQPEAGSEPSEVETTEASVDAGESEARALEIDTPLEELVVLVEPLTRPELVAEAETWRDRLKAKAVEVSEAVVDAQRQASEDGEDASGRAERAEAITALRTERTVIMDKLRAVVEALESKTASDDAETTALITDHRLYMSAVDGIQVDVTDAQSTWTAVTGWIASEQGGIRWAWNLALFVGILMAARLVAALVRSFLRRTFRRIEWPELLEGFLLKSSYWVVMVAGLLLALSALEVSVGPLVAVVGAAGFVVAFAVQDSLSNFASGLMILFFRPFDTGDVVEAGGVSGTVESMNLVSTTVKTFDNKRMIVPNNAIVGNVITNATGVDERRVDLEFGVGYDDDIDHAQSVLEKIVSAHPQVLEQPEPVIRVNTLGDSSVNFVVRPWVRTEDYWTVYWDLIRQVKQRFDAEGIGIPYPQQDVHLHVIGDPPLAQLRPDATSEPSGRGRAASDLDDGDGD